MPLRGTGWDRTCWGTSWGRSCTDRVTGWGHTCCVDTSCTASGDSSKDKYRIQTRRKRSTAHLPPTFTSRTKTIGPRSQSCVGISPTLMENHFYHMRPSRTPPRNLLRKPFHEKKRALQIPRNIERRHQLAGTHSAEGRHQQGDGRPLGTSSVRVGPNHQLA